MRYAKEERCQKSGGTGVRTAGFLVAVMYIIAVTGVAVCALSFARGAGAAENEVIEIGIRYKRRGEQSAYQSAREHRMREYGRKHV